MKKYIKELIILVIQLFMFYIFPLFCGPTDAMGMVYLIWLSTIVLGIFIGVVSIKQIKYLYPFIISIIFIPSIFIYYNESAIVHSIWYFASSFIGIFIGCLIKTIIKKIKL